jgi:tricorn protease-like protein
MKYIITYKHKENIKKRILSIATESVKHVLLCLRSSGKVQILNFEKCPDKEEGDIKIKIGDNRRA